MIDVTRPLARFIVDSQQLNLPADVWRHGVSSFVNWFGCTLGGCHEDSVDRALDTLSELAGKPEATVLGRGIRMDVLSAAFINSLSDGSNSYNDTHLATVAHPTGPAASAIFALAEKRKITGTEFIHALILGVEIECRIANVLAAPPAQCHFGLSMLGVTGVIGGAVAAGKLMRLSEEQMIWAIGNAVAQSGGVRSTHGSMASHVVAAHGARNGLFAAHLAAKNFTCSEHSIEGPKGLAAVFGTPPNIDAALDRLGSHYEIMTNAFKPYPAGIVNHAPIDVCLAIVAKPGFDPTAVERVEIAVNPLTVNLCDRVHPRTRLEALVSAQHWAAVSLLYGEARKQQGSEAVVNDPKVRAFRDKIVLRADPTLPSTAAKARVQMADGRILDAHVAECRGSLARPMTEDELRDKFLGQSIDVVGADPAKRLLDMCWAIAESQDVGALANQLPC